MTRNLFKSAFAAAALLALGYGQANAAVITLDFEKLQDQEPILNYYNGGFGGNGTGPGPSYGITFTADSLALKSADNGGGGNFNHQPSGTNIAFFLSGAGDTMNVPGGFDTGFSFFYTSPFYAGNVNVYDGVNGTGTLLATLPLATTVPNKYGGYAYDDWEPVGVAFAGTAQSVVFSGVANFIGFDDITLGSKTPGGGAVPEPGSVALLMAGGMTGAAFLRRRRAR